MEWRPSPGLRVIYVLLAPGLAAGACWFFAAAVTQPGIWRAMAIFALGLLFLWSAWAVLGALLSYVRIEGDELVALNWPGTVYRSRLAAISKVTPGRYGLEISGGLAFRAVAVRDIWDRSAREETRAARIAREIESAAGRAGMPEPRPEQPPGLSYGWFVERLGGPGQGGALLMRPVPGAEVIMALIATALALVPWLLVARWLWTGDWPLWQWVLSVAAAVFLTGVAGIAWWRVPRSEAWLLRSGRLEIGVIRIRDRSWIRPPAAVIELRVEDQRTDKDEGELELGLVAVTRPAAGERSRRRKLSASNPTSLGSWLAGRTGLPLTIEGEEPAALVARARSEPGSPPGWLVEPFPRADGADGHAADTGVLVRPGSQLIPAIFLTGLMAAFGVGAVQDLREIDSAFDVIFWAITLPIMSSIAYGLWVTAFESAAWHVRPGRLDIGKIRIRTRSWITPPTRIIALELDSDAPGVTVKARLIGVTRTGEREVLWQDEKDLGTSLQIGEWLAARTGLPLDQHAAEEGSLD